MIVFQEPGPLPDDDQDTPYFIIGDNAFPLKTWMMKPFGHKNLPEHERIFNYRLSRARRIVENAFGILGNIFQCLLTMLKQEPDTVHDIVLTCICLHNLVRIWYPGLQNVVMDQEDNNDNDIHGDWRNGVEREDVPNITLGNCVT